MNIFIDSDVVISSLLSSKGAAFALLHKKQRRFLLFISNISQKELRRVIKKFEIETTTLELHIKNNLKVVDLADSHELIKQEYKTYVKDVNDSHIVAGAHRAKVRFLITYNIKHFKVEKIKNDFDITILTPGMFLQYIRSLRT